jgi:hypothetical protein
MEATESHACWAATKAASPATAAAVVNFILTVVVDWLFGENECGGDIKNVQ